MQNRFFESMLAELEARSGEVVDYYKGSQNYQRLLKERLDKVSPPGGVHGE